MNQSYRASKMTSAARLCGVVGIFCFGTGAFAQSAGALATSPYVPFPPAERAVAERCVCATPTAAKPDHVVAKPVKSMPPVVASGGQVLPIVMFRGTPAPPLPRPAVVSMVPVEIARPQEAPRPAVPLAPPPAPIMPAVQQAAVTPIPSAGPQMPQMPQTKRDKPAGPFKRIWRDTKKSVVTDIPEALADALPWVDRGDKDEPIDQVLARVSSDLSRASAQDPEWVNPAESELRELSKRLSTLAEPPVEGTLRAPAVPVAEADAAGRPFRPRPIWPGASGRPETQSRPTALVTGSTIQQGPEALGQRLPPPTDWVEDEEKVVKPPVQQVVAKRVKRPTK